MDSETVAAWRQRMGTEEAKTIYKERAATAECANAIAPCGAFSSAPYQTWCQLDYPH